MAFVIKKYRSLSRRLPLSVAFATCFLKGGASDLVAQTVVERRVIFEKEKDRTSSKNKVDFYRTLAFSLFSGCYLGCCQHFVYNVAFTRIFGSAQHFSTALKKVSADLFVHAPFVYLPLYYSFEYKLLKGSAIEGLKTYLIGANTETGKTDPEIIEVMTNYAKIWPGVMLMNFTVTPPELRIAVIAGVSFAWLIFLSTTSHEKLTNGTANEALEIS